MAKEHCFSAVCGCLMWSCCLRDVHWLPTLQVPIYKPAEAYLMFTHFLTDTLNDLTNPVVGTLPIPPTAWPWSQLLSFGSIIVHIRSRVHGVLTGIRYDRQVRMASHHTGIWLAYWMPNFIVQTLDLIFIFCFKIHFLFCFLMSLAQDHHFELHP